MLISLHKRYLTSLRAFDVWVRPGRKCYRVTRKIRLSGSQTHSGLRWHAGLRCNLTSTYGYTYPLGVLIMTGKDQRNKKQKARMASHIDGFKADTAIGWPVICVV